MEKTKINTLVVDDHTLFRKALIEILKSLHFIGTIREAPDGFVMKQILGEFNADLLILDLEMPGKDGLELSEEVRSKYPDLKILILTMYNSKSLIRRLLEVGINGFLLKSSGIQEVEDAVRTLIDHDFYYNRRIVEILRDTIHDSYTESGHTGKVILSNREKEVLRMICREYNSHEIAKNLTLSVRTVEKIRGGLLEKLNARNTVGLIKFAYSQKLAF